MWRARTKRIFASRESFVELGGVGLLSGAPVTLGSRALDQSDRFGVTLLGRLSVLARNPLLRRPALLRDCAIGLRSTRHRLGQGRRLPRPMREHGARGRLGSSRRARAASAPARWPARPPHRREQVTPILGHVGSFACAGRRSGRRSLRTSPTSMSEKTQ